MEKYVSGKDLAIILNVSERWVNKLALAGVISRTENGNFDVAESVEKFFKNKFRTDEKKELDFDKEHALLERVKRRKAELDLAQRQGRLLEADDVEKLMADMILTCKARLLALPTAVAPKILGKTELPVVVAEIKNAVFAVLEELKEIPAAEVIRPEDMDEKSGNGGEG